MVVSERHKRPLILLADDDEPVRGLCRTALERGGYDVVEARNAVEALGFLGAMEASFALMITDVVMPGGMDGVALGEAVRRLRPGLPILYMTGYSRRAVDIEPVLRKPFSLHELLRVVGELVQAPSSGE